MWRKRSQKNQNVSISSDSTYDSVAYVLVKTRLSEPGQKLSLSTDIIHTGILIYSPINASFDFKTVDIKKLMITTPKRDIIVKTIIIDQSQCSF